MEQDQIVNKIIKRQQYLENTRSTWESHWREIDDYVAPSPNYFNGNIPVPGVKVNDKVFDDTATLALDRFTAAMSSTLTPRSQTWHALSPSLPSLDDDQDTKIWCEQVTEILFSVRYAPKANFQSQIDECYRSQGKYGTACLFVDDELGKGIRYKSIHLSEIYIAENAVGIVDTVFRKFEYTASQAVDAWGYDNVPQSIQEASENSPDKCFWFIHAVYKDDEYEEGKRDSFKFKSCYVHLDSKTLISEGGYRTFPYMVARYITSPQEQYGRSPAMTVLAEIKTLNRARKAVLKGAELAVMPPLLAQEDGALNAFNMTPGAINYGAVDDQGRPTVIPLQFGQRVDIGVDQLNQMRTTINDAFLVTLFQILVQTPQMTATEAMYRQQEKGALLAPTMGRQQTELLGPMIERELDILSAAGVLPPMPQALLDAGSHVEIEYQAPLNKAQRSDEGIAIMNTLQAAASMAQFDPTILQIFNMDVAMRKLADINGMPAEIVKSPEQIAMEKAQAAQQQQLQQILQAAPAIGSTAKDLASAQQMSTAAGPGVIQGGQ